MRASKKLRTPIWSPRSQKSWLKQRELEAGLDRCRNKIAFCERRISEGKKTGEAQAATVVGGVSYAVQQLLTHTLSDVAERERELAVYRLHEASLQAEINVLAHPTFAKAAQRAKRQGALAALAVDRWEKDAVVDSALQKLRQALQERDALTTRMLEVAALLDFASDADFDAARFASLERSLPAEVLAQSHEWLNNFLGQASETELHTIGSAGAVLPETLADAGVYRPGDSVRLSEERARMLPSEEAARPVPTPAEMEASVSPAGQADSFPVSGFRVL
jgi:hypothetical protein